MKGVQEREGEQAQFHVHFSVFCLHYLLNYQWPKQFSELSPESELEAGIAVLPIKGYGQKKEPEVKATSAIDH